MPPGIYGVSVAFSDEFPVTLLYMMAFFDGVCADISPTAMHALRQASPLVCVGIGGGK